MSAIIFAMESSMKWACDRLTGIWRIAVCDAFFFISFIATVNVWRGMFQLLELYFMPGDNLCFLVIRLDKAFL